MMKLGLIEECNNLQNLSERIQSLPESIRELQNLQKLDFERCKNLQSLPESIGQLQNLQLLWIYNCEKLQSLHKSINQLKKLRIVRDWG